MINKIPFSIKASSDFIATLRSTAKQLGIKQQALLERAIEFYVASLSDEKSNLVQLPMTPAIFAQLSDQAAAVGYPGVAEYIAGEVLLLLRGTFVECPACHRPTADERQIPVKGVIGLTCMWCGIEFQHDV